MNINLDKVFINVVNYGPIEHNRLFIDADQVVGVVVFAKVNEDALINDDATECVIWFTDSLIIKPMNTIIYPIRYLESPEEIVTLSN